MTSEKYLTVAEYAERTGLSKQAVYKRLNNQLKRFTTVVDIGGKQTKVIDMAALEAINPMEEIKPETTTVEQPDNHVEQLVESLQKAMEVMEQQLAAKDQQIAALTAALAAAHESLKMEQQLHAGTIQRGLLTDGSEGQPDPEQPELRLSWWRRLWK